MKGSLTTTIGFIIVVAVFFILLLVLLCYFDKEMIFCDIFEPFVTFIQYLISSQTF